jgi:uncharacterized protein (TIGR03437 family)
MKRKSIAAVLWPALALASSLPAQTAQTALFRAVMPSSMSSASRDSGAADVVLHVVKDASGNILSGSVDFNLAYQFPNDESVTGLGIADTGGGTTFLVATNITAASPVLATAGNGRIFRQVQVMPGNQVGLSVLSLLFANPSQYSIGVVTADQPAGAMSGPLQAGSSAFLMALLNSSAGTGVATVIVSYTGTASAITSGEVTTQLTYQFPAQVTFSDMRVYAGQGENGQIAGAADLMPGTPSAASGAGVLTAPATQIDMTDSQMVQAVQNMLAVPTNFSVDVDTVENASAPLTGQLRGTDFMTFAIPGFAGAGAASEIGLHTLRDASGSVLAGTVVFDVNYRLKAGALIMGIDIDGNVTAPAVSTDPSGSGNAYTLIGVYGGAGLTSLNGIVADPAAHQIDVLTTSTMRAPLAAANTALPVVAAVIPIVEVKDLSTFAPGELVEIYGTNLAQLTTDLSGWPGESLPSVLNGVSVTLGGQTGRILYVSPYQVDAAFAFETPAGSQMLTLTNANGTSAPVSLNVAAVAPALYNFAFKNADFSLVSSSNPAQAGDVLVFYTTGMGQTTSPLITGQTVPLGPPYFETAKVTVTIGGANANVIYSIAAPPYVAGLYQMAVTVPSGLAPGNRPVVATSGGIQSNTVTIVVE